MAGGGEGMTGDSVGDAESGFGKWGKYDREGIRECGWRWSCWEWWWGGAVEGGNDRRGWRCCGLLAAATTGRLHAGI